MNERAGPIVAISINRPAEKLLRVDEFSNPARGWFYGWFSLVAIGT